ncbi:glutamine synthetase family protein [Mycolicibacter sinensis]|uniref:Glutamine synthetase n=1 Tax=Mycolicibacter sinensis (strain JDM601) TaxID=875328 RepID=A0A1A2F0F5_MYCSD|nr:glutamine synthetase family protein [Mycolicibacter sinensis]OBF95269.1 glutamine synthetase [Mycolicibacter sinensis]OBG10817.1 glutamine synthetase [Mycolicibacter sinensis]
MTRPAMLSQVELQQLVGCGEIDTVVVALTDMQGRLVGKRVTAQHFLDEVAGHGVECCSYLLAVDVEMNTVPGYPIADWGTGYGDLVLRPDFATLRRIPWLPSTAHVLADAYWPDGNPVAVSPRQILAAQLARLAERELVAYAATELEFLVFDDSYRQAWAGGYRGLTPGTDYNADYGLVAGTRLEPLLRDIRLGMTGAGMRCEGVKGECHTGQQEITFRYDEALVACDNHSVYKSGAKEIADQHGKSLTFMAKFDEREGNSCHVHLSLRSTDGSAVFADPAAPHGMSAMFRSFLAGVLATLSELTLCYAPNINSYKRFVGGSFAPTVVGWGLDNRTCALRVIGRGDSLRMECRVPGGDVNPYLAVAALIAAGLHGIDNELELPDPVEGDAYHAGLPHLPSTLAEAAGAFAESAMARKAFGDDVVAHYLHGARVELDAFNTAVTDWERVRGFERF